MQLKRRSNMAIYPKIETRRVNRRNGTAYQHRRRRSLTGGLSVITHGRRMEYERSHSMFLTHSIARLTTKSWSDRASLPRKRARSAHVQKRERVLKDSEGIELTPYRPARFGQHLSVRTQLVLCLREHSLYTISFEKIEPTPTHYRGENRQKFVVTNKQWLKIDGFEQKSPSAHAHTNV